jgi:hypothetical protein
MLIATARERNATSFAHSRSKSVNSACPGQTSDPGRDEGREHSRTSASSHFPNPIPVSNRELSVLERGLSYCKQRKATLSNRELSTNQCCCNFCAPNSLHKSLDRSPIRSSHSSPATSHFSTFLPGSASRVENDVTCSKQIAEKFLPGARTAHFASRTFSHDADSASARPEQPRSGMVQPVAHFIVPQQRTFVRGTAAGDRETARGTVGLWPTTTFAAVFAAPKGTSPEKFSALPNLNRQTHEFRNAVTYRKQTAARCSNSQKNQKWMYAFSPFFPPTRTPPRTNAPTENEL